MFKRSPIFAAVVAMLLVSLFSVAIYSTKAQSDWSAYMFNGVTQQLLRVRLDGTTESYDLGIPEGSFIGAQSIDFSTDGNRIAYCVPLFEENGSRSTLYIKDIASTDAPLSVDLGKGDGCWVTYSDNNTQVAVGVVHYYAGDPNADTSVPPWELLVFDAASGQRLYEMNAAKAVSVGFDPEPRSFMPDVRYFNDNQVIFAAIPWGTDAPPISPAYLWLLSDDSVQPIDRWWRSGVDSLSASGELVWLDLESSIPAAEPGGPLPLANVVRLADKSGQEYPIYVNSDWVLTNTAFIADGTQLAIGELQAFDPNTNPGSQTTRWIALDRSGNVTELASGLGFSEIAPAPNGYLLLWADSTSATPLLTLDYRNGSETTTLWQEQATSGIVWSLAWTAETAAAQDALTPFPAVTP
jgi:hypothetical protein